MITERKRLNVPAFFWPLVGLALWTLVSSAFSMDPFESFKRDRQLLLYLIVPMTMTLARGPRATTTANVIIALGAAGALVGIVQYAALGYDNLHQRPHGLLGHYMTYSGVLMLVICTAAAQLLFRDRDWVWPAVAVPALLVALVATYSRNAWIGARAGHRDAADVPQDVEAARASCLWPSCCSCWWRRRASAVARCPASIRTTRPIAIASRCSSPARR